MWISRAKQTYNSVITLHFRLDFKMNSFLISVNKINSDSNTAVIISEEVTDVLSEWNMPVNWIVVATTDIWANFIAGVELLVTPHLLSFSHTASSNIGFRASRSIKVGGSM